MTQRDSGREGRSGGAPAPDPGIGWRIPLALFALGLGILWATDLVTGVGALAAFAAGLVMMIVARSASRGEEPAVAVAPPAPPPVAVGAERFADALPDPAYLLDPRGVIRHANSRALAAFPLRRGDLVTSRLRAPDLVAALGRLASGGEAERVDFVERVPSERWFAAWFAPLSRALPAGTPTEIVLIVHDETERHQSERMRVDFVANASHELRTPLASLSGFIETLQGRAKDDPVARDRFLAIMHDQATRMSRLIDDLLSLSRIELKEHVRPRNPVDLVHTVRTVIDALEPLARDTGVAFETSLPEFPVIVPGDRDEIVEVLDNLIENACKYGRSGGRVVVSVTTPAETPGEAVLSVRDFGQGISREHLPRLTERFYRVADNGESRGTGLGLAIVKHIIARHRARLEIESRQGEGATFRVRFADVAVQAAQSEEAK